MTGREVVRAAYEQTTALLPARLNRQLGQATGQIWSAGTGPRRALLAYVKLDQKGRSEQTPHANVTEALSLVAVMNRLGFAVDTCAFDSAHRAAVESYDLIVGLGLAAENAARWEPHRVVGYLPGAPHDSTARAELRRLREIEDDLGVRLPPIRSQTTLYPALYSASKAIVVGSRGWALEEFRKWRRDPCGVRLPVSPRVLRSGEKLGSARDRHHVPAFVWFGSSGAVLKGLDLLILAFKSGDLGHLVIAGNTSADAAFWRVFGQIVEHSPFIHPAGHVMPWSRRMRSLMRATDFVVLPSASEGTATGVLSCMAHGKIPIVSDRAGITWSDRLQISRLTVDAVAEACTGAGRLSRQDRWELGTRARRWVAEEHTIGCFQADLHDVLRGNVQDPHW